MYGRALIRFIIAFLAFVLALHGFFSNSSVSSSSNSGPGWFFSDGGGSWGSGGSWDSGGGDSGSWDSGGGDGGSWDSGGGDSGSW